MDPAYSAGFFFNHTCPNEFIQAGIARIKGTEYTDFLKQIKGLQSSVLDASYHFIIIRGYLWLYI